MTGSKARWKRLLAYMLAFAMVFSSAAVSSFGTATVQAASKSIKSVKVQLKVGSKDVTKKTITLGKGCKVNVDAIVRPKSAKKSPVKFASAKKSVATVNKNGIITGKKVGTAKINVTAIGKDNKKVTTYVKVKVVNVSLKLNKKNASLNVGKTTTLKATVTPKDSKVTWSTSNKSVAVTSVEASMANTDVSLGNYEPITVTVLPSNATDKTVSYSVDNPAIAEVVKMDGIDMVHGLSEGEATITVSSKNGKKASVKIKVVKVPVEKIEFTEPTLRIDLNGTTTLAPKFTPENASVKDLEWSSSDPAIATVDEFGKVTAKSTGEAIITAKAKDGSGVSAVCTIIVSEQEDMTIELVHAYEETDTESIKDTVLFGEDMLIKVHVADNGQAVPNENVTLRMYRNDYDVNAAGKDLDNRYEIKKNYAVTDSNGDAIFVVGLKDEYADKNATNGVAEIYTLTATRLNVNANATHKELTVNTATIGLGGIKVDNTDKTLEASDNAENFVNTVYTSMPKDATATHRQYVVSQKVSPENDATKPHRVVLKATPMITYGSKDSGDKENKVWTTFEGASATNGYPVYNGETNESTTARIADIPLGIRHLNVDFKKVDLSKYTRIEIDLQDSKGALVKRETIKYDSNFDGTVDGRILSKQFELQNNAAKYRLAIKVITEGKVDASEKGYVLDKVEGVFAQDESVGIAPAREMKGDNLVTWTDVSNDVTYDEITLTNAQAYIPGEDWESGVKDCTAFTYKVPRYPYTGDAFIYAKNGSNVKAIYAYPAKAVNNKNVIEDANIVKDGVPAKAILVTRDEAETRRAIDGTDVTRTDDGSKLIVNSTKTGVTSLKATINVKGLSDSVFNKETGKELYTAIHWAPYIKGAVDVTTPNDDFYAVEGQIVKVQAQLLDDNGNAKSSSNQQIQFKANGKNINVGANDGGITCVTPSFQTDTNGRVVLELLGSADSYVQSLTATAENYKVRLSVIDSKGKETVVNRNLADIYWVDLGLSYSEGTNSATTYDGEESVNSPDVSTLDKQWLIGYRSVGKVVSANAHVISKTSADDQGRKPITVKNAKIDYSLTSSDVEAVSSNDTAVASKYLTINEDKSAKIASDDIGWIYLNGKFDLSEAALSDIVFNYVDKDGKTATKNNVGFDSAPDLKNTVLKYGVNWVGNGKKAEINPTEIDLGKLSDTNIDITVKDNSGKLFYKEGTTVEYDIVNAKNIAESLNEQPISATIQKVVTPADKVTGTARKVEFKATKTASEFLGEASLVAGEKYYVMIRKIDGSAVTNNRILLTVTGTAAPEVTPGPDVSGNATTPEGEGSETTEPNAGSQINVNELAEIQ
ncbi:MAG: hypothetical protein HFH55_09065 [Lachnospiraceae bacterium]|nr:hypothetical protein [Lachnospiraceae bacterium]